MGAEDQTRSGSKGLSVEEADGSIKNRVSRRMEVH